jgi:glycerate kinase
MHVLLAPDSFKGSATATEVIEAIAAGWRDVRPNDQLTPRPFADGGEGTLQVIATARQTAIWHHTPVTGPDGRPVVAMWLMLEDNTAVIELAAAGGLPLMAELNALSASTYGVGELIAAALDGGAQRIVLALGGSASTDGGAGALQALGAQLLDDHGRAIERGGGALAALDRVDLTRLRPPPPRGVDCLVDVRSPLIGPSGAAEAFGPQKGASPHDVRRLEDGLTRLAHFLGGDRTEPGSGAAGGTAYGFAAAWGARLVDGAPAVAELTGVDSILPDVDVIVTGEGRFDVTSRRGKVVGYWIDMADRKGIPLVLIAGDITVPVPSGVITTVSLTQLANSGREARKNPSQWLRIAGTMAARALDASPGRNAPLDTE